MRVIDSFCGCGGFALGFSKAGFDVVGAFDHWAPAIGALNVNGELLGWAPGEARARSLDLTAPETEVEDGLTVADLYRGLAPEVMIGGPPCQDFSTAGKGEEGARAGLTFAYARLIDIVGPEWFVIENVVGIKTSEAFRQAKELLGARYELAEDVLDAATFGVPQRRRRFFCVGRRRDLVVAEGEMAGFFGELKSRARGEISVRRHFREIGHAGAPDFYYRHPHNYGCQAIYSLDEPSTTIRSVNRPMPASYFDRYERLRAEGRLHVPHNPAVDAERHEIRAFTVEERGYVQTFPRGWTWPEKTPKGQVNLMIGNAVPVNLAAAIGEQILSWTRLRRNAEGRRAA